MSVIRRRLFMIVILILIIVPLTAFDISAQEAHPLFKADRVSTLSVTLEESDLTAMLSEPLAKQTYPASMRFQGRTWSNLTIRTKGNSSLTATAKNDSLRFSFSLDLNDLVKTQNWSGVTEINLNNQFADPSRLREFLAYQLMEEAGLPAPRHGYVELELNGRPWGLYLAVESLDEHFIRRHMGSEAGGTLYKPAGKGGDLVWRGATRSHYSGIETEFGVRDQAALYELMQTLTHADSANQAGPIDSESKRSHSEALERVLDVDSFIKYLAFNTLIVNLDSYQGYFHHNYYLFERDGRFTFFPWDFDMAFGGLTIGQLEMSGYSTGLPIDEPIDGSLNGRPLVTAILRQPAFLQQYHDEIRRLLQTGLEPRAFAERAVKTQTMIEPFVLRDPQPFFTVQQFRQALYSSVDRVPGLLAFHDARVQHVRWQLEGKVPRIHDGSRKRWPIPPTPRAPFNTKEVERAERAGLPQTTIALCIFILTFLAMNNFYRYKNRRYPK